MADEPEVGVQRVTVHAFYVKYLLPIWFDVQCIERTSGPAPERSWQYV